MSGERSLIQRAEILLAEVAGHAVNLIYPEKLSSENTVLRCQLAPSHADLPQAVILKQVTTTTLNNPSGPAGESHRFLNEWACLEFLTDLPGPSNFGPRLLASDRYHDLVILEDLGKHGTVLDLLLGDDHSSAQCGLTAIGTFLGKMQAATLDREEEFSAVQSRVNAAAPLSESTVDFRKKIERFQECFAYLDIQPMTGFWDALRDLENSIHGKNPFRSFIHADAGPHNFLHVDGAVQLIDYEFGTYGHGLLDVVSARLGFPQTDEVRTVPPEFARQLEQAYQQELVQFVPQAGDDMFFAHTLVDACAHWALSRWIGMWRHYFKERLAIGEEHAANMKMALTAEAAQRRRAEVMTLYQSFIHFARETNHQLIIAETLDSYVDVLKKEWPDLEAMPTYPGLQGISA